MKTSGGGENKNKITKTNNQASTTQGGLFNNLLNDGYLEFKDLAKWKEIVFKIKLTEAEYKLLIKEKANLVNLK